MSSKHFYLNSVAIRLVKEPPLHSDYPLDNPDAVVKLMADTLKDYDREVFAIVNLQADLRPINVNIVSVGALEQSLVHPREVMKSTILSNAAAVMLVHNHPSGRLTPSREDIAVTDRMGQVCGLLGVRLVEHVIVGRGDSYFSFHEKGMMPLPEIKYTTDINDLQLGGMKVAETTTEMQSAKKVSFTVAECGEFHNMGELHENVGSVKEALSLFEQIPGDRMHGIPTIGIRVTDVEHPEIFTEIDIANAKFIDLGMLDYVPEIAENKAAQFAIAELIHAMPDAIVKGEVPEAIQKKVQMLESREKQAEQLKEITDKLEQGVAEVFSSDNYKQFLDTMAKFPRYSVNNNILIMMQKPDAQICQSFTGWKEMGRFVKKGEKGIKILAPAPYTIQREQTKLDESGKPMLDRDGEPIMESVEIKVNAFKVVSTFDVSQTDGKELPTLGVDELMGSVEGYGTFFEALKQSCPVPMTFEEIEGGAKGFYSQVEKRIAIQEGMSEAQTVKTAIHEMAHQKLHAIENKGQNQSRNSKEVEAESVAYTVCQHYGIDTSDYSFSYVAGWSEGKEMPELKASLDTIRRAASEMISSIDEKLEELMNQKTQEHAVEQPQSVSDEKVDRKEELAKLMKETAEQLSPEAKKPYAQAKDETKEDAKKSTKEKTEAKPKKTSVKSKLKEGKEKVAKTPAKKTKEKEALVCV